MGLPDPILMGAALAEPWNSGIMVRAFAELTLLGVPVALLGAWIVLYRLSYAAESLAHAMLPGLVAASLLGVPLMLGGLAGLLAGAAGVAAAARTPTVGRDSGVAVAVTGLSGLGVLMALSPETPRGLQGLLFGDVLGVTDADLAAAGGLALVVLVSLALLHRRLLAVGFDGAGARALIGSPGVVEAVLLVLLALATVVGVQAMGNLLVFALLVGPAATARLIARRMWSVMASAVAVAVASGVGGLYLSYYASLAGGASVAACLVTAYGAALSWRRVPGRHRAVAPS